MWRMAHRGAGRGNGQPGLDRCPRAALLACWGWGERKLALLFCDLKIKLGPVTLCFSFHLGFIWSVCDEFTPQQAMRAAVAVPGVPRDEDGPVFREPWEARAFAMALALHEAGVFTWKEWAETLGAQIKRAQAAGDPDTGETYYRHWLATLETLVAAKGVTTSDALHRYRDAWDHAADRTPHGAPIELTPGDFRK